MVSNLEFIKVPWLALYNPAMLIKVFDITPRTLRTWLATGTIPMKSKYMQSILDFVMLGEPYKIVNDKLLVKKKPQNSTRQPT